jgi:predicted DNA-binding transcriptional regulator
VFLLVRDEIDTADPLLTLSGNSLEVYMLLLSARSPLTIRDIQRRLGFKSPNSVRHHLERLASLRLVRKEGMGYVAVKPKRTLLNALVIIGGRIVPRRFFTWLATLFLSILYVFITPFTSWTGWIAGLTIIIMIDSLATYDFLETYIYLKPLIKKSYRKQLS